MHRRSFPDRANRDPQRKATHWKYRPMCPTSRSTTRANRCGDGRAAAIGGINDGTARLIRAGARIRPRASQNAAKTRIKAAFTEILKVQFKPDLHHREAWSVDRAPLRADARIALCARVAKLCLIAKRPRMAGVSGRGFESGVRRRTSASFRIPVFTQGRGLSDDERSIRDHLAAHPAPSADRPRDRTFRLRAAVVRTTAAIGAGTVRGVAGASGAASVQARRRAALPGARPRLRLQACGLEGHGPG